MPLLYFLFHDQRHHSKSIPCALFTACVRSVCSQGGGRPQSLVPGPFLEREGVPQSLVPGPFLGGGGTPTPWRGPGQGHLTPPPHPQHAMDRKRRGQYASCGHAGGLCFYKFLGFKVKTIGVSLLIHITCS